MKKIAKANSTRLNTEYAGKKEVDEKKLTVSNGHTKRNIVSRKSTKNNNKDFVIKQKAKRDEN